MRILLALFIIVNLYSIRLPFKSLDTNRIFFLTVDDGPNYCTIPIAKVLKSNNIQAIWFLSGNYMDYPSHKYAIAFLISNGFLLGNHTKSHSTNLNRGYFYQDIKSVSDFVWSNYNIRLTLFRPPYGLMNNNMLVATYKANLKIIPWTLFFEPWPTNNYKDKIHKRITEKNRANDIILMHSEPFVMSNTQGIIDTIKKYGKFASRYSERELVNMLQDYDSYFSEISN
jgi:peptidoglycan/xylan/chitin deacetylase (PgdA/CDA1 family)